MNRAWNAVHVNGYKILNVTVHQISGEQTISFLNLNKLIKSLKLFTIFTILIKVLYVLIGHVDEGESDYTAAVRETKEEAGLNESDLKIYSDSKRTLEVCN